MNERFLIVSLHDFHPGSLGLIREQVSFLAERGVPNTSILVVPDFHHAGPVDGDGPSLEFLNRRAEAGDDLVLHGYFHDRQGLAEGNVFWTRFYTANEAEFLDLDRDAFCERIEKGRAIWERQGWPLAGFIAPAWLHPQAHDTLLAGMKFTYTTRLRELVLLASGRGERTQSLCYSTRSWWRRPASLLWNRHLWGRLQGQQVIRLSLHPNDLRYPAIRKQIGDFVEMALADGRQPITYSRYAAR